MPEGLPPAERLAIELGEDFRLMADLGWQPQDGRDTVELTMSSHDLMEIAKRPRDEAQSGLHPWGGKDSNLRPTDYESRRNPSIEPNLAR